MKIANPELLLFFILANIYQLGEEKKYFFNSPKIFQLEQQSMFV